MKSKKEGCGFLISLTCWFLLVGLTLPAWAANNITCASGTACKAGTVPVFTTSGGAAKVDSSIVSQSGSTISVAGDIGASGAVNATTGFEIGNTLFDFGSVSTKTALMGFAGNSSMTGNANAAAGIYALKANTSGPENAAFGAYALGQNTTGGYNAAFGYATLYKNTTSNNNSAFGYAALYDNTGTQNQAFGYEALEANTTGNGNSAFGTGALYKNTTGGSSSTTGGNSAFGNFALLANTTAGGNSAYGYSALTANTTGNNNVAVGAAALAALTTGSGNVAIGTAAGGNLSGAESNDIYVGNSGIAGESNTIRIGYIGTTTAAYIAGISGNTSPNGVQVLVNGTGQLGTTTSSRRFKHEITDMGAESDVLMKLRPVAFYYKPELDETQTRQYGLVAEEVAQVAPELVVFDKDGAPQTVRYHFVNAMLLNEVQKQRQLVDDQNRTIMSQQQQIQDLAARIAKLEALLTAQR